MKEIEAYYDNPSVLALKGISLDINEGEIVAIVGHNGSGKSTTLRTIFSIAKLKNGEILYQRNSIKNRPPRLLLKAGIGYALEGRRIFSGLTIRENLEMGAYIRRRDNIDQDLEKVYEIFPALKDKEEEGAYSLSGGEQQMLSMGMILMANPKLKLMLLDEPTLGLSPLFVKKILNIIKDLNAGKKITILMVEHTPEALAISDRGYVFHNGKVVDSDMTQNLLEEKNLRKTFLGI